MADEAPPPPIGLGALFRRFLRYGFLAWGGPGAQIALMQREVVERDHWITNVRFRKVFALYQALPGPEAHELAVYFGMIRRGRIGGLLTGLGFMLPGVVLVGLLAAAYAAFAGTTQYANILLYGVKPAVLGLVVAAVVRLARSTLLSPGLILVAVTAFFAAVFLPRLDFLWLLLAGGLVMLFIELAKRPRSSGASAWMPFLAASFPALHLPGLSDLSVLSLRVGLLTFGGAYTALPILHDGAVLDHGWITEQEFIDGLALAALVPGPLVAIGTFVGYLAAGWMGAVIATVLIFAPAFAFTLIGHTFFERAVDEPRFHAFLLGVTGAAIGLIAAVTIPIAQAAIVGPVTATIALVAIVVAVLRPHVPLIVLGGAVVGVVAYFMEPRLGLIR